MIFMVTAIVNIDLMAVGASGWREGLCLVSHIARLTHVKENSSCDGSGVNSQNYIYCRLGLINFKSFLSIICL